MGIAALKSDQNVALDVNRTGVSFGPLDSNIYSLTVEQAYMTQSKGGAYALNLEAVTDTGAKLKQQFWMTSGTAKGCSPYYTDKDGNKKPLPGFTQANTLSLLTVGKEISEVETEDRIIKLWDYSQSKEVPTSVQSFDDLIGQEFKAGVLKQVVDKNVKDASGNYVPSGETREINEIDKIFRARDDMSYVEIIAQAEEAGYIHTWLKNNLDKVVDKSTKDAKPVASSPAAASAAPAPTTSLFS
jgi:hypothetical protein